MKNIKLLLALFFIMFLPLRAVAISEPELCIVDIPIKDDKVANTKISKINKTNKVSKDNKNNKIDKSTKKTVKYTVPIAKTEAFQGIKYTLPVIYFKSDMVDRNHAANLEYIQKNMFASADKSRLLFPNFIGETLISYAIRYTQKPDNVYHYNSCGKLLRIEIDYNNPDTYPKKSITYNSKGKLHSVVLYISPTEQYNFDGQGNLVVHWIGNRGFNRSGQLLKVRRSI